MFKARKTARQARIVLVTCGNLSQARRIAESVVTKHLAACVNILPGRVESIYRWKGKAEKALEVLLLIKTSSKQLVALEKEVKRLHSYEVPEFLVLPVSFGSPDYLSWLMEGTQNQ